MGHVASKTSSLGQIIEDLMLVKSQKNLVYALETRLFRLILMKHGQNVCLDEISYMLQSGSCWVKK